LRTRALLSSERRAGESDEFRIWFNRSGSEAQLIGKEPQRALYGVFRRHCICLIALTLGAGIVEAVRCASVEANFDGAALGLASFYELTTAARRYFLVGGAVEHLDRRVRQVLLFELPLQPQAG